MMLTRHSIAFDYILASTLLKSDHKTYFGLPLGGIRWQAADVMQRLVDAGLAKVQTTNKNDGKPSQIWATNLTVQQVEDLLLTAADKERINKWIEKGVVKV